jgi:hypothetical protein
VLPRAALVVALAGLVLSSADPARAQGEIDRARRLFESADYLGALAALPEANAGPTSRSTVDRIEIERYRLLCLIALGRTDDANRAIRRVVEIEPFFRLSDDEASPSVRARFDEIRAGYLPDVARAVFVEGRRAYEAQDFATATERLEVAQRLIEELDGDDRRTRVADLKTITSGFLALMAEAPPPAAGGEPGDPGEAAPDVAGTVPPVAISQTVPAWPVYITPPPSRLSRGSYEVVIDESGAVTEVIVRRPLGRVYDAMVLDAAKSWRYQPARKDGQPTTYRQLVELVVRPQ